MSTMDDIALMEAKIKIARQELIIQRLKLAIYKAKWENVELRGKIEDLKFGEVSE